jgi:TPR repeat protein
MKKMKIRVCLALLVCAPMTAVTAPGDDPQAEIDAGFVAFQRGDIVAAINHYTTAAESGSADGQARLAWILDQSEQNEDAVKWYRAAADQNHADGQYGLGEMYSKGEGVEKNESLALEHFMLAAENGHEQAQRVLINAYRRGLLGLQIDAAKADEMQRRLDARSAVSGDIEK